MKPQAAIIVFIFYLFLANSIKSQTNFDDPPMIPMQQGNSVLFGKDIIIDDQPALDQRNVCVCSAFNGWLYALYTYPNASPGHPGYKIFKSTDNGISWTMFHGAIFDLGPVFYATDIIVCGNSVSTLKLFFVYEVAYDQFYSGTVGYVRLNGETGALENGNILENGYDIAIASDFMYPSTNSNPFSVGILYSMHFGVNKDSIIFISSSDGGMNFDNRKVLAGTNKRFHKVSLSFGKSLSQPSGRYYAAWEGKADVYSNTGHIYTAHSEPNFNSPFTIPVMLDNLDPASLNNVKNPAIACQYNNIDNDSTNITEVVLYDKFNPTTGLYEIDGFSNMKSTGTNNFQHFTLNASSDSKQQASIKFNPFDSSFMVTYYDSTVQKLPFLKHNLNMINPGSWQVVSAGYNDSSNLASPYPKVSLDMNLQKGINVWSAQGTGGNGKAMFDATYSTYTFISPKGSSDINLTLKIYPNPCSSVCNIEFDLKVPSIINVRLVNTIGQVSMDCINQLYENGHHVIKIDLKDLQSGVYFFVLKSNETEYFRKVVVVR